MRSRGKRKRYFDHRAAQEHYAKTHKEEEPIEELIYFHPEGTYLWIGEPPHLVRVQPIRKSVYTFLLTILKPRYRRSKEEIFQETFRSILPQRTGTDVLSVFRQDLELVVSEWNEDICAFVPTATLSSNTGYLNDIGKMIDNL